MLYAAVRSGADAVYLGLPSFNARRNAENFTLGNLGEVVSYCHIRGVKVYLTLNIALRDQELNNAIADTVKAAKLGVDGVITADIGFAKRLKSVLPNLPIHASTQMTVHSKSAIKSLKEMGFSRVVVSREMSKKELQEFCCEAKKHEIEVEVFVHGALCMSMSGQCLLSAMLGGRSGNRGLCAGPCRLPFSANDKEGYDLSLKDLSLIPYIKELSDMGVACLKIEGRMKRPEYVAAATAACRQMLDSGAVDDDLLSSLEKVFSRSGFTDGYYKGKLGKDMFGIRTKDDVVASDTAFAPLHELYRRERQSVTLSGQAKISQNTPISLTVSDGEHTVSVLGDIPETALSRSIDEQTVIEKLSKTGDTPYLFSTLVAQVEQGLMVRVSSLNNLRRTALEQLSILRGTPKKVYVVDYVSPKLETQTSFHKMKTVVRIDNLSQLTEKALSADLVVIPIDVDVSLLPETKTPLAIELPRGISNEEHIKDRLKLFAAKGVSTAFCSTLAATNIAKGEGFTTVADFGYNIYNSASLSYHEKKNVAATLSPELLLSDVADLSHQMPLGIISYGRLPLMLSRNCPVKNKFSCLDCGRQGLLTDRKNTRFPIRCRNGYSELLNSKVIWLADRIEENAFLDYQVLYFTDEAPSRVDEVLQLYGENASPDCDFTRGLYYRGVE